MSPAFFHTVDGTLTLVILKIFHFNFYLLFCCGMKGKHFFYSEVQVLSRYMLSVMHRYLFNNNRYTCWCVFVTLVIQFNTSYNKILISNVIFTMQLNLQLLLLSFFEFIFAGVCVCLPVKSEYSDWCSSASAYRGHISSECFFLHWINNETRRNQCTRSAHFSI